MALQYRTLNPLCFRQRGFFVCAIRYGARRGWQDNYLIADPALCAGKHEHFPAPHMRIDDVDSRGGPPEDRSMEARVAKLEADVTVIKLDVAVIKTNGATKSDVAETGCKLAEAIAQSEAKLGAEIAQSESRLEAKIAQSESRLDTKIAQSESALDTKIAQSESALVAKIAQSESRLETKISQSEAKLRTEIVESKSAIIMWVSTVVIMAQFIPAIVRLVEKYL